MTCLCYECRSPTIFGTAFGIAQPMAISTATFLLHLHIARSTTAATWEDIKSRTIDSALSSIADVVDCPHLARQVALVVADTAIDNIAAELIESL